MGYKVLFPSVAIERKFQESLEDVFPAALRAEIMGKIQRLAASPRPHGTPKIKPPIHVYNIAAQYRLRVGDYRVLYDVDDSRKIVWILTLRRRSESTYL